jgi:hypothetical protein
MESLLRLISGERIGVNICNEYFLKYFTALGEAEVHFFIFR